MKKDFNNQKNMYLKCTFFIVTPTKMIKIVKMNNLKFMIIIIFKF